MLGEYSRDMRFDLYGWKTTLNIRKDTGYGPDSPYL